jgi:hypoxanthine phosphoribosyltransferase
LWQADAVNEAELDGDISRVLYTSGQIAKRMTELAVQIDADYKGKDLTLVGVLNGAVVRILKDLSSDITGVHVLVVEDIVDTGLTLSYLVSNLVSRGPASLKIMAAFRKPEAAKNAVDVAYVGFDIPNEFVVGYGLDYDGRYRNLTSVATLAPHIYQS